MKKILLAIAIVLTMGLGANAQYFNSGRDGFFNDWEIILRNFINRGKE